MHNSLARMPRRATARLTLSWKPSPNYALPLMPGPLLVMKALQSSTALYRRSSTAWAMTRVRGMREISQSYSANKRSANGNTLLNPTLTHKSHTFRGGCNQRAAPRESAGSIR